MSKSYPPSSRAFPADSASFLPLSERSTSVQPVKRFSRFHSLSPWRSNTSFIFTQLLCLKIAGVSDSRLRIYYTPFGYAMLRLFILFKNNLQIRMIATAGSPIFFLNSCRDNRIHGVFDGRSDLHKALGEDIKEHGASSAPCFYVRIIFEQEKLSVFRLYPTEASYLRHSRLCETGNLLLFLYRPRFP